MESQLDTITVNGIEYVKADQYKKPSRAVVIVDRGWIFAGDVTRENGRIKLTRAVHVVKWSFIGFDRVIKDPKSPELTLKPIPNSVDIPEGAEVFCVPVPDDWGI
jgi:hypothetical protein